MASSTLTSRDQLTVPLGSSVELTDKREKGRSLDLRFHGTLRPDQIAAGHDLLAHENGVLHAPPGFGETVTAAWLIAQRDCSTLGIVHTVALLAQWRASLALFLGRPRKVYWPIRQSGQASPDW